MAVTKLTNLYEPLTFNAGVDEKFDELNAFLNSGIMTPLDELTAQASAGGMIGEMPFFKPLDVSAEPNYTDDTDTEATPDKVTTGKQIYRLAKLHKSWGTRDFAVELGLSSMDPMAAITSKVGTYYSIQTQYRLIKSALGVLADNIANDSGDMVYDIYSDVATPADATKPSADAILDARQTAGDHGASFTAIAMHSVTFNALNKQNLIDFIPNALGVIDVPTYLGMYVTVDDSMPVTAGTNSPKYTTMLFTPGAFGFGNGRAETPSEIERNAAIGKGGGEDVLHVRRNPIIHPAGYQFLSANVALETATWAELAEAASWDRVMSRKNVRMAFFTHNN